MSSKAFDPIVAVGMATAREASSCELSPEQISFLENNLSLFIKGSISYHECSQHFLIETNSTKAVDKISDILSVANSQNSQNIDNQNNNNTDNRRKARSWTQDEDIRLLAGIHLYGLDSWGPVTQFVGGGRTRAQCSQRWFRGLDPRISKVLWTPEEEARLVDAVTRFGDHAWTKVAAALGNRSDAQCRYHFYQLVNIQNEEEDLMFKSLKHHEKEHQNRHSNGKPTISTVSSAPASQLSQITSLSIEKVPKKTVSETRSFRAIQTAIQTQNLGFNPSYEQQINDYKRIFDVSPHQLHPTGNSNNQQNSNNQRNSAKLVLPPITEILGNDDLFRGSLNCGFGLPPLFSHKALSLSTKHI
ncbi:Myb-like DNA-binding domain containing protein [Tritrichomonas foetus]|uniref:Myb-like DNA-binding domain containing protein n=1 Tax=Tritrichomonas foetus TaxID=1144522 RepID=A0A1J4J8U0_9EUKA|nr:Myb-like DNA-binding domain containing protein [Tritrichomonas foetus]|eukprot:OHS94663.1 Myb-like DNA-binding domain containing protein [Tritrichomonas foetus]